MDLSRLGVLALVVFAGFLVETAAGFGAMVVALALGALTFSIDALLGLLVPVNLALSSVLLLRGAKQLEARWLLVRVLPFMAVGLGAGLVLVRSTETAWLKPALGVFVVAVAASQLLTLRAAVKAPLSPWVSGAVLLAAGVVHGVFATGGPLAVVVASRALPDKAAFRATLAGLWVALNLMLLPQLWAKGLMTVGTLKTSAVMLLPLALGLVAGEWVHARLEGPSFRALIACVLLAAGLTLLWGAWRAGG